MGTTYMDFGTGSFHVDGDAPLTQEQVDSIWLHLPTTGASWVARGNLLVQQRDGATAFNLGPVEPGIKGVSDAVRIHGTAGVQKSKRAHSTRKVQRHHSTKKTSSAQLDREIAEALARGPETDAGPNRERWRLDPSQVRVGQRFDYFGQEYEITKIGRDKERTVQVARRAHDRFGKELWLDQRSFPLRTIYRQHLAPIRG